MTEIGAAENDRGETPGMIPSFDDNGNLPQGIHPATLEEIVARFGKQSEIRQAEVESLGWLVDLARRAGIKRLVIVTLVLLCSPCECGGDRIM